MKRRQILRTALIGTSALLVGTPALATEEPEAKVFEDNGIRITPGYRRDHVCIDRGTPGYATVAVITETDPMGGDCDWRKSFQTRIDQMFLDTIRELSEEGYVLDHDYHPQVFWNGCSDLVWDLPASVTFLGTPRTQGSVQGRMDPAWLRSCPGLGVVREAEGIISLARTKGIRSKDFQDDLDCIDLRFRMKADLDTRKGRDMFRAHLAEHAAWKP